MQIFVENMCQKWSFSFRITSDNTLETYQNSHLKDRLGGKRHGVQPTFHNTRFFFCIFQTNFAMATLGLKEMGKFLWEGREKAIADFFWKMQRKTWYSILGLDATMPLSLKNLLLIGLKHLLYLQI